MLDFARPAVFSLEPADLVHVCRDAADAASAAGEGPPVVTVLPPDPILVVTDAERLRTALLNLLANARQAVLARDSAGETPRGASLNGADVELRLERHGPDRVRMQVSDRGMGIRAKDMPQIFEPYFTTRRSGTGLGLPIARNIVEGLGGTLAIRTAEGGTTIDIDLPAHPPGAARA